MDEENIIVEEQAKPLKKTVNNVFKWVIIYNILIMFLAAIVQLCNAQQGMESVLSTLIGVGLILLFTRKKWPAHPFESHRKMTGKDFFFFFCLMGICQILTLGIMTAVESAGVSGTNIPMDSFELAPAWVIYAGFTGPFCEEMIYRGFMIGNMRKYGKVFAVVLSAIAFGLMHVNATQFVVGFLSGILLGYIFTEYSIVWTIIFHVINNFVFTELPQLIFKNVSMEVLDRYIYIILGVFSVIGVYMLIKRWPAIKAWFTAPENRAGKGSAAKVLSCPWFLIFLLIYVGVIALMMIFPDAANQMMQQAMASAA